MTAPLNAFAHVGQGIRRLLSPALLTLTVGLALIAVVAGLTPTADAFVMDFISAFFLVTSASLVIAGTSLLRLGGTGRAGAWLAAAGVLWATNTWTFDETTLLPLLASTARGGVWAALLLAVFATPRSLPRTRLERWSIRSGVGFFVASGLLSGLLGAGQWWNAQNTPWSHAPGSRDTLKALSSTGVAVIGFLVAIGVAVLVHRRLRRMSALQRNLMSPVVIGLTTVLLANAVSAAALKVAPDWSMAWAAFTLLPEVWMLVIPLTVGGAWLRRRRLQESLAQLPTLLSGAADDAAVEQSLRAFLRDPTLQVLFHSPVAGRYTDSAGRSCTPEALGDRLSVKVTTFDGAPLAVVCTNPDLALVHDLVSAASTTAGVVIENNRLHTQAAARLRDLERAQELNARTEREERSRIEAELVGGLLLRCHSLVQQGQDLLAEVSDADSRASIEEAVRATREAADQVHRISHGLRLRVQREHGLAAALRSQAQAMPFAVSVEVDARVEWLFGQVTGSVGAALAPSAEAAEGAPGRSGTSTAALDEHLFDTLFWCLREALHNARKHAHARQVWITVDATADLVRAQVVDDGVGGVPFTGTALFAMRQRALQARGLVAVESPVGQGTAISLQFHHNPDATQPGPTLTGDLIYGNVGPSPAATYAAGHGRGYFRASSRGYSAAFAPTGVPGAFGYGPSRGAGRTSLRDHAYAPFGEDVRAAAARTADDLRVAASRLASRVSGRVLSVALTLPLGLLLVWVTSHLGLRTLSAFFPVFGASAALLSVSLVVVGALLTGSQRSRTSGLWIMLTGVLWPLSSAGIYSPLGGGAFTTWVASAVIWLTLLLALSCFPRGLPWHRSQRGFIAAAVVHLGVIGIGQAVIMRPEWAGMSRTAWWPTVVAMPRLWEAVNIYINVGYVVLALWYVRITRQRGRDMSPLDWSLLLPAAWATGIAALVASVTSGIQAHLATPEAWAVLDFVQALGVALLPLSIVWVWLQTSNHRAEIGRVISDLARAPGDEQVRAILQRWLHDGSITILYWSPQMNAWVSAAGEPTPPPSERERLLVAVTSAKSGEPLALVSADQRLRFLRRTIQAALTNGYSLENLRLHALNAARAREIERSRTAAVDSSRDERQRASGDLHDGPANTLTSVAMLFDQVRRRHLPQAVSTTQDDPAAPVTGGGAAGDQSAPDGKAETTFSEVVASPLAPATRQAQIAEKTGALNREAEQAAAQARSIAHRLSSRVLHSADLGAAIDTVADDLPVPVDVQVDPQADAALGDERLRDLAYMWLCDALADVTAMDSATEVMVDVTFRDGHLVLAVYDDATVPLPQRNDTVVWLRGRAAALDGTVEAAEPPSKEVSEAGLASPTAGGGGPEGYTVAVRARIPWHPPTPVSAAAAPSWPVLPEQARQVTLPDTHVVPSNGRGAPEPRSASEAGLSPRSPAQ